VPVNLRRLEDWPSFGEPERVWRQQTAQAMILQAQSATIDFTGWGKDRFAVALAESAKSRGALYQFQMQDFITDLLQRPGQFDAARCCPIWLQAVLGHRSSDMRTMVVGVTDAGLFVGDTNYVFGAGLRGASLLSYQAMLAKEAGDAVQSRQRVVQRLAKEVIPQALGQLGIPRPADPTDPYSSSSGIQATDAKSMTLSQPTLDALARFR
jgi:predicted Zn-dependent protease